MKSNTLLKSIIECEKLKNTSDDIKNGVENHPIGKLIYRQNYKLSEINEVFNSNILKEETAIIFYFAFLEKYLKSNVVVDTQEILENFHSRFHETLYQKVMKQLENQIQKEPA